MALAAPGQTLTLRTARGRVDLRPQVDDDALFLRELFASTIPEAIRDMQPLVDMQFKSREYTYRTSHPAARFDVIEQGGVPVGRIVFDASSPAASLVDWAFLPHHRGKGIGTAILAALLACCAEQGQPVEALAFSTNDVGLHVLRRLGFAVIGNPEPYVRLRWAPG